MEKTFGLQILLVPLMLLASLTRTVAQTENAKLDTFFRSYLDERFRLRPMAGTEMGDHRFDAQLEDLSPEARNRWLEQTRQALSALPKAVTYEKLSRDGQIDYEILEHSL